MERLTEWKDDKKLLAKAKFSGDFGSQNILQSLAEYEDLEELIGISLKNLAEICNNKIPEECKNPKKAIVLTNEDADRWSEYKSAEEQGLLLRLPCKVGDIIYEVHLLTGKITERKINSIVVCNCPDLTIMYKSGYDYSNVQDDFGKTVFLTQEEAEQKLKEMERD